MKIRVAPLSTIALYPERAAPATALSINQTTISAEIAAVVIDIPVKVGNVVKRGETIVRLDCRDYKLRANATQARIRVNEARAELAKRRVDRTQVLAATQSAAKDALDERESELAVLQQQRQERDIERAQARLAVSKCEIPSPYDATVTARTAAVGQYVGVGDPIMALLEINNIELTAQVTVGDVARVENAGTLWFEHMKRRYDVAIRQSVQAIDAETRSVEIRLTFIGDPPLSGAAGQLIWREERPHVAGDLLVRRNARLGIFVHDDGHARFVALENAQSGRAAAVDLPMAAEIIVDGQFALRHGAPVELIE